MMPEMKAEQSIYLQRDSEELENQREALGAIVAHLMPRDQPGVQQSLATPGSHRPRSVSGEDGIVQDPGAGRWMGRSVRPRSCSRRVCGFWPSSLSSSQE